MSITESEKSSSPSAAQHYPLFFLYLFLLSWRLPSDRLILDATRLLDVWQPVNKQTTTCDRDTDQELIATD